MFLTLSIILYTLIGYLSIYAHVTYIVHDLSALRVAKRYKSWVPCKMISSSQLVYGFRQSRRYFSTLSHN